MHLGGKSAGGKAQQSEEYKAVWELEVWKKGEQAKFKNHLKQTELETIEKVTADWKAKEDARDAELASKVAEIEAIDKRLRMKVQQIQKRESKIVNLEEELKVKIHEVSRQLAVKEEEIINIKKRFKEEKIALVNDKKNMTQQVNDAKALLDENELRFRNYRKDMEESPLSVLRADIGKKNVEIAELNTKFQKANEDVSVNNLKFKKLRQEHTKLKRELERQKDESMQKQAEEIERMKFELKNQNLRQHEHDQITMLKEELTNVQTKLLMQDEEAKNQHMYIPEVSSDGFQTKNISMNRSNPFATQNMARSSLKVSHNKSSPSKQQNPESNIERLQILKQSMLQNNFYKEDDDFIIGLDDQIRKEQNILSPSR